MNDELQLLKEDLEKERNNIRNYMYHPSFAGHSKREKTAVYEALGIVISRIDSIKIQKINECPDFEEELERFAYSLLHSADGFWPKDIDPKSVEARTKYGVHHAWSYEQVKKIASHFAVWKESQLMKGALDCSIIMHPNNRFANYSISAYVPPLHPASTYISNGDKVKIIIIREEEK